MLRIREGLKIYLCQAFIDMRRSISGLSTIVLESFKLDPKNGSVYIFYNKAMDKLKILFYDRNGFVLYYKILDKKRFSRVQADGLLYSELTAEELDWLLAGLDIECMHHFPEVKYRYFL